MSYEKFKPDNVGETIVTIVDGQFKGTKVIVRTAVSNVVFEGNFEKDGKTPIFRVTHHDSFVVIPAQTDVRKLMK